MDSQWVQFSWIAQTPKISNARRLTTVKQKLWKSTLIPEDMDLSNPGWSARPVRCLFKPHPVFQGANVARGSYTHHQINFQVVTKNGHKILERLVVQRLPYMKSSHFRTVKEYIEAVAVNFNVNRKTANLYVQYYQIARFRKNKCFEKDDFVAYMDSLLSMMKAIRSGWYGQHENLTS